MEDKFVIVRKKPDYKQFDAKHPRIHVSPETYSTLVDWAVMTGLPISELAARAVKFAAAHAEIVDE